MKSSFVRILEAAETDDKSSFVRILEAAETDDTGAALAEVAKNHDINSINDNYFGHTALINACISKNKRAVQNLIKCGACIDKVDIRYGSPALHYAPIKASRSQEGRDILELLLKAGASLDIINKQGNNIIQEINRWYLTRDQKDELIRIIKTERLKRLRHSLLCMYSRFYDTAEIIGQFLHSVAPTAVKLTKVRNKIFLERQSSAAGLKCDGEVFVSERGGSSDPVTLEGVKRVHGMRPASIEEVALFQEHAKAPKGRPCFMKGCVTM